MFLLLKRWIKIQIEYSLSMFEWRYCEHAARKHGNGYCCLNSRFQRIMQNCWIPQAHGKYWAFGSITVKHSKRTLFMSIKTQQLLPFYNIKWVAATIIESNSASADPFLGGKVWTARVLDFKMYFVPRMCWSKQVLVGAIRAPRRYYSWNNQKPLQMWRTGPNVLCQHFSAQALSSSHHDYPVRLLAGPWNPPWRGPLQIASTIKIRR